MSNIKKYPKCQMRTSLGNCDPIGGFCTSVNEPICEALHKAAEPKRAYWRNFTVEENEEMAFMGWMECSNCRAKTVICYKFCFNCGAKMGVEIE